MEMFIWILLIKSDQPVESSFARFINILLCVLLFYTLPTISQETFVTSYLFV